MPEFQARYVKDIEGLDAFTQDYLETIEWLLGEGLDENSIRGFAPSAVAKAKADCLAFQQANADDLRAYQAATGHTGGVDLWLTQNGHGAGFWDRGLGALGYRLTSAARLGTVDTYQDDDGYICLS